ncbi:MAG: hypothetical protein AB7S50_12295 [Bacteroidales bacterium]
MNISYLHNDEINFVRWDNCINNAFNGNIFAFSWYLNILCDNWCGLIMGDYKYVMPLIPHKVFNKKILITPVFGEKLGVFTNQILTENIVNQFLDAIPLDYSYATIILNKYNKVSNCNFEIRNKKIFDLDLIQSYSLVSQKYSNSFQKYIQTAKSNRITILNGLSPNDLINLSLSKGSKSVPKPNTLDISRLRMIIAFSIRYNLGEIYGAFTAENNLCAAAFFIKSKNKIYLLFSIENKSSENSKAMSILIDRFIENHCEKNLTLSLDNLVVKDASDFLHGVGAIEYKIKKIYRNKLPFIYKLLIK